MGSGRDYHSGSLAWLFRVYALRGILFDRVYGACSDLAQGQGYVHGKTEMYSLQAKKTATPLIRVDRTPFPAWDRITRLKHRASRLQWGALGYIRVECKYRSAHYDVAIVLTAWEPTAVEPTAFWATIPDGLKPVLSFYNMPLDAAAKSPINPLNVIRCAAQRVSRTTTPAIHQAKTA